MAQYEIPKEDRDRTYIWRVKWETGKNKSGRITLSYSYNRMAAQIAPEIPEGPERLEIVSRYFDRIANSIECNIEHPNNPDGRIVKDDIRFSHRMIPQKNGEIILEIFPNSKAPTPAEVLRAALKRPAISIWRIDSPDAPVLKAFMPQHVLGNMLGGLLNEPGGPGKLPPRSDETLYADRVVTQAMAAGSGRGSI